MAMRTLDVIARVTRDREALRQGELFAVCYGGDIGQGEILSVDQSDGRTETEPW